MLGNEHVIAPTWCFLNKKKTQKLNAFQTWRAIIWDSNLVDSLRLPHNKNRQQKLLTTSEIKKEFRVFVTKVIEAKDETMITHRFRDSIMYLNFAITFLTIVQTFIWDFPMKKM